MAVSVYPDGYCLRPPVADHYQGPICTSALGHLSDNHHLWPEDCYTSHSLSRPSTGDAISSCPLLVHPMQTLSAVNSLTSALLIWMPPLFKSTRPQPMLRITRGASRITAPCIALMGVLLCAPSLSTCRSPRGSFPPSRVHTCAGTIELLWSRVALMHGALAHKSFHH